MRFGSWILLFVLCCTSPAGQATKSSPSQEGTGHHDSATAGVDPASRGLCDRNPPHLGAIPPMAAAWCLPLVAGANTAVSGKNSWVDLFQSGLNHAQIADGYRVFETARDSRIFRTKHFAHNGHWMVDVAGSGNLPGEYAEDLRDLLPAVNWGGGLMRPDRTFRFSGGRFVIEFDVAAGMLAYREGWPEVVLTTAAAPTGVEVDQLHAIGLFGGAASVGCRLYTDRTSNCSAYDSSGRHYGDGGRIFELSAERHEDARVAFGGAPTETARAAAWRQCAPTEPDTNCRDRFKVELTADSIRVSVNGTVYMEHSGLPLQKQLPKELMEADLYVYFASWAYLAQPGIERFHWGRLAINPE